MKYKTFKEAVTGWTDEDLAQHHLAICLGLMPPDIDFATEAKHVYWTDNPVGDTLYRILYELVATGILEENGEGWVRWNPTFR